VGFWSHHAMIDRIWYFWQLSELGMDPPPDMMSTVLAPFPMTVAQTLEIERLGYDYAVELIAEDRAMALSRKKALRSGRAKDAIVHRDLSLEPGPAQESAFKRADLVFEGWTTRRARTRCACSSTTRRRTRRPRRILSAPGKRLETLTFVPVSRAPRREERGLAPGPFKYHRVSLRTYR
jgi:hypothetical protein